MKHIKGELRILPLEPNIICSSGKDTVIAVTPTRTTNAPPFDKAVPYASTEQAQANAEHLVKCWNCHDQLLDACKAAQIMLLQTHWNGDERMYIVSNAIAVAERKE